MSPRSYLYVPADQDDKVAKAPGSGADALILDLEDSVPPDRKAAARENAAAAIPALSGPAGVEVWARINADTPEADVAAVAVPGLAGIVVPKAEPPLLALADLLLTRAEEAHGLRSGTFAVLALIESAVGVAQAERVAAAPRVTRLGVGEADLAGELGLRPGPAREELWPIRSRIVVASAVAGILPPVGPVETAVRDLELLESGTRTLLRQGFRARTALSPRQSPVINEVFTPSAEETEEAGDLVRRLAEGVTLDARGRFIDPAVVRSAHEVLARAANAAPRP
ncbi:HpcH/HpaI aldolase/citrate lyase family protein [Herbidospora yilanensis]|uniref:HpcH/HpaI aldolase/citrate lyase family protein n=1 Tax=Herbidospora yilanensis TaxID=354426 RepID=UPI000785D15B|nr:aldolase/citrate lyase family protein [Herbidospora yilanensis]